MVLREKSSKQKQMGAYYTPPELAYRMADILTKGRNITTALEPSCGEGVFIEALYKTIGKKEIRTTAVEINAEETTKLKEKWKEFSEVTIYNEDFFSFCQKYKNDRYDLIIGNPPYIRYQYLSKDQRKQVSELLKEHGMKANRLSNAWVGFMTACISMLNKGGQIAFVIPVEIIHVSYAMELREHLLRELSSITLISFHENVFPGLQQEILIFIGEKGKEKKGIRIVELEDISQLTKIRLETRKYVWSPDAFFLRRSQQYPRFTLNQSEAVCTDNLHRITFTAGEEPEYIVLSYYNSISFAFTELCGRSYGGGVLELLPTETGNIYLPVITGRSDKAVKILLQQVDAYVREDNIEAALDLVDTQVLQKQLGIPEQSCMMARNIWKKLRKRRTKKENMR